MRDGALQDFADCSRPDRVARLSATWRWQASPWAGWSSSRSSPSYGPVQRWGPTGIREGSTTVRPPAPSAFRAVDWLSASCRTDDLGDLRLAQRWFRIWTPWSCKSRRTVPLPRPNCLVSRVEEVPASYGHDVGAGGGCEALFDPEDASRCGRDWRSLGTQFKHGGQVVQRLPDLHF
jgi:hypothetical protein